MKGTQISRREFLKGAAAIAAGVTVGAALGQRENVGAAAAIELPTDDSAQTSWLGMHSGLPPATAGDVGDTMIYDENTGTFYRLTRTAVRDGSGIEWNWTETPFSF